MCVCGVQRRCYFRDERYDATGLILRWPTMISRREWYPRASSAIDDYDEDEDEDDDDDDGTGGCRHPASF